MPKAKMPGVEDDSQYPVLVQHLITNYKMSPEQARQYAVTLMSSRGDTAADKIVNESAPRRHDDSVERKLKLYKEDEELSKTQQKWTLVDAMNALGVKQAPRDASAGQPVGQRKAQERIR